VGALLDEHGRGGVPDGVAAGLEGRAHASRGERRCIGLGLEELRSREGIDGGDLLL
jgi:hypothetical protein